MKLEKGHDDEDNKPIMSEKSNAQKVDRHCRLPKLELPVFNGNPLQWNEFWDQFRSSIHANESINDIDRFSYLSSRDT